MSYEMLTNPVELTDAELDAVAAGQPDQVGLVNAQNILNKNDVRILNDAALGVAILSLQRVSA